MKVQPMISVIIPVYNAAQYLPQCLDSIINQTHRHLEIICVNDASTDNSLEILNDYKDRDHRIKIIDKINEGVSVARNAALDIAKGEFILFVDADDWIDLDTCEKALNKIQDADVLMWSYIREFENNSAPRVIFDRDMVFNREQVLEKLHRRMIGIVDEELAHPENADVLCTIWGKLYRRSAIGGIRFIDIRKIGSYEDGLFNLYVFERIEKASFINEYYYHYRKTNAASITTQYNPGKAERYRELFKIMQQYIQEGMLGKSYQTALNNRIALSVMALTLNVLSSNKGLLEKLKEEKEVVSHPIYRAAFREFSLKYFPLHWKLFYGLAKINCSTLVYVLGLCIAAILQR